MTESPSTMVPSEVSPDSDSPTAPGMRRVLSRGSTCLTLLQASLFYLFPTMRTF